MEIDSIPQDEDGQKSYVTLGVRGEVFAVDVHCVREILEYRPPVPLHQAPVCFIGMVDVRGTTVPVIDLSLKLGLASEPIDLNTRILVLEIPIEDHLLTVGLMVSRVFEVAELQLSNLEMAPDLGFQWNSQYIEAIGRLHGGFVIVFNMQKLFSADETVILPSSNEVSTTI
jgi:purine-binding chemotaxis protein CheW